MFEFRRTLVYLLIFTAVSSFIAYKLVVLGYDKMYDAQAASVIAE